MGQRSTLRVEAENDSESDDRSKRISVELPIGSLTYLECKRFLAARVGLGNIAASDTSFACDSISLSAIDPDADPRVIDAEAHSALIRIANASHWSHFLELYSNQFAKTNAAYLRLGNRAKAQLEADGTDTSEEALRAAKEEGATSMWMLAANNSLHSAFPNAWIHVLARSLNDEYISVALGSAKAAWCACATTSLRKELVSAGATKALPELAKRLLRTRTSNSTSAALSSWQQNQNNFSSALLGTDQMYPVLSTLHVLLLLEPNARVRYLQYDPDLNFLLGCIFGYDSRGRPAPSNQSHRPTLVPQRSTAHTAAESIAICLRFCNDESALGVFSSLPPAFEAALFTNDDYVRACLMSALGALACSSSSAGKLRALASQHSFLQSALFRISRHINELGIANLKHNGSAAINSTLHYCRFDGYIELHAMAAWGLVQAAESSSYASQPSVSVETQTLLASSAVSMARLGCTSSALALMSTLGLLAQSSASSDSFAQPIEDTDAADVVIPSPLEAAQMVLREEFSRSVQEPAHKELQIRALQAIELFLLQKAEKAIDNRCFEQADALVDDGLLQQVMEIATQTCQAEEECKGANDVNIQCLQLLHTLALNTSEDAKSRFQTNRLMYMLSSVIESFQNGETTARRIYELLCIISAVLRIEWKREEARLGTLPLAGAYNNLPDETNEQTEAPGSSMPTSPRDRNRELKRPSQEALQVHAYQGVVTFAHLLQQAARLLGNAISPSSDANAWLRNAFEQAIICVHLLHLGSAKSVDTSTEIDTLELQAPDSGTPGWYIDSSSSTLLYERAPERQVQSQEIASGIEPDLLDCMQRTLTSRVSELNGLKHFVTVLLRHLISVDMELCKHLERRGIPKTLRAEMNVTSHNDKLMESVLLLHDIVILQHKHNREQLFQCESLQQALEAATSLLDEHHSDTVRLCGARCLASLGTLGKPAWKQMDHTMAQKLSKLLKAGDPVEAQDRFEMGILALLNFSQLHANQILIARYGLKALMKLLRGDEERLDESAQTHAAALMANLSRAAENRTLFYREELRFRKQCIEHECFESHEASSSDDEHLFDLDDGERQNVERSNKHPSSASAKINSRWHLRQAQLPSDRAVSGKRWNIGINGQRPQSSARTASAATFDCDAKGASTQRSARERGNEKQSSHRRPWSAGVTREHAMHWRPRSSYGNFARSSADLWGGKDLSYSVGGAHIAGNDRWRPPVKEYRQKNADCHGNDTAKRLLHTRPPDNVNEKLHKISNKRISVGHMRNGQMQSADRPSSAFARVPQRRQRSGDQSEAQQHEKYILQPRAVLRSSHGEANEITDIAERGVEFGVVLQDGVEVTFKHPAAVANEDAASHLYMFEHVAGAKVFDNVIPKYTLPSGKEVFYYWDGSGMHKPVNVPMPSAPTFDQAVAEAAGSDSNGLRIKRHVSTDALWKPWLSGLTIQLKPVPHTPQNCTAKLPEAAYNVLYHKPRLRLRVGHENSKW